MVWSCCPTSPLHSTSLSVASLDFASTHSFFLVALPKGVVLVLADGLEREHAGLLETVQQVPCTWQTHTKENKAAKGNGQNIDRRPSIYITIHRLMAVRSEAKRSAFVHKQHYSPCNSAQEAMAFFFSLESSEFPTYKERNSISFVPLLSNRILGRALPLLHLVSVRVISLSQPKSEDPSLHLIFQGALAFSLLRLEPEAYSTTHLCLRAFVW